MLIYKSIILYGKAMASHTEISEKRGHSFTT